MSSLYEIDKRLNNLLDYGVDSDTGEVVDTDEDFKSKYDEIQMDLETKIENTACLIKNVRADIEKFKEEEDKLAKRRKSKENLIQRLENMIDGYIRNQYTDENGVLDVNGLNDYKFDQTRAKIDYRKSDRLDVIDTALIPPRYIKSLTLQPNDIDFKKILSKHRLDVTEKDVDKATIKKDIKSGEKVEGAEIVDNYTMKIK